MRADVAIFAARAKLLAAARQWRRADAIAPGVSSGAHHPAVPWQRGPRHPPRHKDCSRATAVGVTASVSWQQHRAAPPPRQSRGWRVATPRRGNARYGRRGGQRPVRHRPPCSERRSPGAAATTLRHHPAAGPRHVPAALLAGQCRDTRRTGVTTPWRAAARHRRDNCRATMARRK